MLRERPKSYGQDQDRDCRTAKSARESQLARYIWKNRWNIDTTIPCEMDSMPGLWSVLQWKCLVSESRETKEKQTMKPLFSAVYTLKMILPGGWTPYVCCPWHSVYWQVSKCLQLTQWRILDPYHFFTTVQDYSFQCLIYTQHTLLGALCIRVRVQLPRIKCQSISFMLAPQCTAFPARDVCKPEQSPHEWVEYHMLFHAI